MCNCLPLVVFMTPCSPSYHLLPCHGAKDQDLVYKERVGNVAVASASYYRDHVRSSTQPVIHRAFCRNTHHCGRSNFQESATLRTATAWTVLAKYSRSSFINASMADISRVAPKIRYYFPLLGLRHIRLKSVKGPVISFHLGSQQVVGMSFGVGSAPL